MATKIDKHRLKAATKLHHALTHAERSVLDLLIEKSVFTPNFTGHRCWNCGKSPALPVGTVREKVSELGHSVKAGRATIFRALRHFIKLGIAKKQIFCCKKVEYYVLDFNKILSAESQNDTSLTSPESQNDTLPPKNDVPESQIDTQQSQNDTQLSQNDTLLARKPAPVLIETAVNLKTYKPIKQPLGLFNVIGPNLEE